MMNYIWAFMMLFGIAFSVSSGNFGSFSGGLMKSCSEGVSFVFSLTGIMAAWAGLMNVAQKSGLIECIARKSAPLLHFLFPVALRPETEAAILMSFTANLFGAGNSSTVFALKSMEFLDRENHHRETASDAMCMFLAVNMSMIQMVPITMIQLRTQAGSSQPGSIILPSLAADAFSLVVSILLCKWFERRHIV